MVRPHDVIEIVFETHQTSEDNERGIATGWLPGRLSALGREQARELGERRRREPLAAVFTSDLARAVETVQIAFAGVDVPVLQDWRLRECDYGSLNGTPADELHRSRREHLDLPYPGGESWRQATDRVGWFLRDVAGRWSGGDRVLVVGHVATRWGLDRHLRAIPLEQAVSEHFDWQPGWEYRLSPRQPGDPSR
ncbi:MAG: histidine phosphatase family protein [Motilibacteraceae bacterium]